MEDGWKRYSGRGFGEGRGLAGVLAQAFLASYEQFLSDGQQETRSIRASTPTTPSPQLKPRQQG